MDDLALRHAIYRQFADTGNAPSAETLAGWVGDGESAQQALRRLDDAHALVLDDNGAIRMALPFSAVPTAYRVRSGDQLWYANCAWDSLAIPAALGRDAAINAEWLETGEPFELEVRGGELGHVDGHVHFAIPARHWWDDIVET